MGRLDQAIVGKARVGYARCDVYHNYLDVIKTQIERM